MSSLRSARRIALRSLAALLVLTACAARPEQKLSGHVPAIVSRLTPVGPLPDSTRVDVVIGLPLRHRDSLAALLHDLYDPAAERYQQYLAPEQFIQRFGPDSSSYADLQHFASRHKLEVIRSSPNRRTLHVQGTAGQVDQAFHLTLMQYHHPTEHRLFFAPDREPTMDLATPILHISGLDDLHLPGRISPKFFPNAPPPGDPRYAGGSGTGGSYTGDDFRKVYAPGVALTGKGQVVGILELQGYVPADITAYEQAYGIPNVPLQNAYVGGYTGATLHVESAADIELAISMAPGLSKVVIYGANYPVGVHDILSEMATPTLGEPLPAQLSTSYYFYYDQNVYDALAHLAAQGQALFAASGDFGSYNESTGAGAFPPADHPLVTSVGGTQLVTDLAGDWSDEVAASFSGGGYSPWGSDPQFAIPSWQGGMNFAPAGGSSTTRNAPDVAMVATNILVYSNGRWVGFNGTSASAPLWAGFLALVNEAALANGRPPIGFANPILYSIGNGPGYDLAFHDITVGNNFNATNPGLYRAVPGYDLVTGWGTPRGAELISRMTKPGPCQAHPEWCHGIFDPSWWLKCPACRIEILLDPGVQFTDVTVYESLGKSLGTFQRLPAPVMEEGAKYTQRITLTLRQGMGYMLRAEPRAGSAGRGSFAPRVLVRTIGRS